MTTTTTASLSEQPLDRIPSGKYLTFLLQGESYGIAVLKVREIIRIPAVTSVAHMPDYLRGVINLRSKIIPVVDLRTKFGMPMAAKTERTCIIVVQVQKANRSIQMGLIVDDVEEVTTIATSDLEPTPDFGVDVDTAFILGMAKIKGKVKTLLDIDRIMAGDIDEDLASAQAQADRSLIS